MSTGRPLIAFFVICLGSLLLAGCAEEADTPPPSSRPVKLFTVEGPGDQAIRNFPGAVQASQRADLAFRVSGVLQEILVREGDNVAKGKLLAKLDPTDYRIVLEDRQATFENARRNFERAGQLVAVGNISQLDYDRMEANYRTAQAALSQAEQDLEYTKLEAPFAGTIARREVENFEEVVAKQTIFRFQNVDQLDIQIDLPESMVRSITPRPEDSMAGAGPARAHRNIAAHASFEGRPNLTYPLEVKEVATKAEPQTQTFRVTLTMQQPEEFNVLPGMTATVAVDFSNIVAADYAKWVPISAVQADEKLEARVWLLNPESMTVHSHPVKIGRMSGPRIEVTDGLDGGEEIVSVGAAYLSEGMKVTSMKTAEQAVPREGEAL